LRHDPVMAVLAGELTARRSESDVTRRHVDTTSRADS